METKNLLLLTGFALLNAFALYRLFSDRQGNLIAAAKPMISDRVYCIILVLTAAVAVFVRVYQFGIVPGGMNQDGAMAAVDAAALLEYGTDHYGMRFPVFLTAWIYAQMASLLSYLMIPFIKVLGLTVVAARLPQLIASLLGLLFLYLLVRDIFDRDIAIVVLAFCAVAPWHVMQSRWALEANLYPHFFIAGIYFLNLALKNGLRRGYLILSMVLFGLCMYCYGVSIYTMPVFLLLACIYLLVSGRIRFRDAALAFFAYMLIAWPFIACMAINYFKIDTIETPLFTIPYFPESERAADILFFSENVWQQLFTNLKSLFQVTILQKEALSWNIMEKFGATYKFSVPFAVTGIAVIVKYFRKKQGAVFILIFLLTGIWCGIATNSVNVNRVNIIYYPIIILTGIGIYYVGFAVYGLLVRSGVALIYAACFAMFVHTYFTDYGTQIASAFYADFADALLAVKDMEADVYYITADTQGYDTADVSEILTLFWHDIDAEYYQGKITSEDGVYYSEKYIYVRMEELEIDPDQDTVYVITYGDAQYFNTGEFDLVQYGSYFVATPK